MQSGLSGKEVNSALDSIAPALLSSLNTATVSAKKKKVDLSDGLDLSDVMGLLGGNSGGSLLGSLFGGLLGGGRPDEKDDGLNGNALLQALLKQM